MVETHISWVILAGRFVYKLRKPVKFGFLDFSTLEQRRADCEAEIQLNRRLCPDLYLGIVNIVDRGGRLRVGAQEEPGEPAVLMLRLPQAGMLPVLIARGRADDRLMRRVARRLTQFHALASTGSGVDEFGTPESIRINWDENFSQAQDHGLIGRVIDKEQVERIRSYVDSFLDRNRPLLERRVHDGRIRDGHGDLHAASICVSQRKLYLFDCVEFNPRFRCADVAAELAFLAMDLDHVGRADLGQVLVDSYAGLSGDTELLKLLDFYKCYRAFVRGKVLGFRLDDIGLDTRELASIAREASAYFGLADTYAQRGSRAPVLWVSMGLPASGKTTLASALAGRLGLVHLSSDVARKRAAGLRPTSHRFDNFEEGLYSASMTRRVYGLLRHQAARWLRRGRSVVLDATYGRPVERAAVRQLARRCHVPLVVLVCRAEDAVLRARLAARAGDPASTSDARQEMWSSLKAAFHEPSEVEGAMSIDTTQPMDAQLDIALGADARLRVAENVHRAA
jgi:uncharacterized protein